MTCQFVRGRAVTTAQPWNLIGEHPRSQGLSSSLPTRELERRLRSCNIHIVLLWMVVNHVT